MATVAESWARIEAWLAANTPGELLASLNPPATEEAIAAAEAALGVKLPDDVRAFYRVHEGGLRLAGWRFPTLAGVVEEWRVLAGLLAQGAFAGRHSDESEYHRSDWWHPKWIPLASAILGGRLMIDLAPGKKGVCGQVMLWWPDESDREPDYDSLGEWLEDMAGLLECGMLVYAEEYEGIVWADEVEPADG